MTYVKRHKKKSKFRKVIHWLHLWGGLVSGLVILIVSITGCLFVFHEEINDFVNKNVRYVEVPAHVQSYPADTLLSVFKKAYPEVKVLTYVVNRDPACSIQMMIMDPSRGKFLSLGNAYINPYNGKVLKVDYTYGVFRQIAALHMNLLLGNLGSIIVRISTIVFFVGLLSGLVLWWPKKWNKAARKFRVKWDARWKRLNLDLHDVFGFYSLPFLIVITFTGLVMAYPTLNNSVRLIFGGKKVLEAEKNKPSAISKIKDQQPKAEETAITLQEVLNRLKRKYPAANLLQVSVPGKFSKFIYVDVASGKSMITSNGIRLILNKFNGKEIADLQERKNEQIRNVNIALHIGSWNGLWYKIVAFLVSLVAASLPVTGFLIWWGKRKKKGLFKQGEITF